ncbi:MAG: RNA polymerase sigma factor region1.1 domain-containing protein, partial [Pseudomonadota bacterium]
MATTTKTKAKSRAAKPAAEAPAEGGDKPILDISDAAIKKLMKTAKQRGYVTLDELNAVLPSEDVTSELIEDLMSKFSDMGVNVIEAEEPEEEEAAEEEEEEADGPRDIATTTSATPTKTRAAKEPTDRTDDPVRMYLREMGTVELLSREGEIAIAKRIEAGREAMIAGLCESPLTFQAIIIWRDELNEGRILLRDIIDLEATYDGPEKKDNSLQHTAEGQAQLAEQAKQEEARKAEAAAKGEPIEEEKPEEQEEDDDDLDGGMSLAAMEAELKPRVLETFDNIAANYKKLRKLQDQNVEKALADEALTKSQMTRYKKLRDEIVTDVKSLSLNNVRIESLVEQLYAINKRLMGFEGRLIGLGELRTADAIAVGKTHQAP